MKKKIIKLNESQLIRVIQHIAEQQNELTPYPSNPEVNKEENVSEEPKVKYSTPESITKAKDMVKNHLSIAKQAMEQLLRMSGVNPQANSIGPDIEKILEKFENLYGEPQEESEEK